MKEVLFSLLESMKEAIFDMKYLIPILFLVYLLIEYLSHKKEEKFVNSLSKNNKTSVLFGALLGCIPQCGFSTVMADMYNHKLINLGTLIAVFVATSDEAIPIMLTYPNQTVNIIFLILTKLLLALFFGYIFSFFEYIISQIGVKKQKVSSSNTLKQEVDFNDGNVENNTQKTYNFSCTECKIEQNLAQNTVGDCTIVKKENVQNKSETGQKTGDEKSSVDDDLQEYLSHHNCLIDKKHLHHHEHPSGQKNCTCCTDNIFLSALKHCLIISLYVFVANVILNFTFALVGEDVLASALNTSPVLQILLSPIIGLIPNCVSSVVLIELYLNSALTYPALIGGLCAGSGVGLVVLFKNTKSFKKNLLILLSLYAIGVITGFVLTLIF